MSSKRPATRGRAGQKKFWNPEADEAICRAAKGKGRFRTLLSVLSNLANLIRVTAVMQLGRPRGVIYISGLFVYIYNNMV